VNENRNSCISNEGGIILIGIAYALGGGGGEGAAGFSGFIPIILMFVIFYFLLIRPQQKRQKEHRTMISSLKKGDRIITSGGLHGRITGISAGFTAATGKKITCKSAVGLMRIGFMVCKMVGWLNGLLKRLFKCSTICLFGD
jgi:preprotein translocase subunit YajC